MIRKPIPPGHWGLEAEKASFLRSGASCYVISRRRSKFFPPVREKWGCDFLKETFCLNVHSLKTGQNAHSGFCARQTVRPNWIRLMWNE